MDIKNVGGNWWSLYRSPTCLEYNAGDNPTAQLHDERQPQASVFRHIDGLKAVAKIGKDEQFFSYKEYGFDNAFVVAVEFVNQHFSGLGTQTDIFS
jgi:hypothetical protein